MNRTIFYKNCFLFLVIISIILLYPTKVSAKEEIITCNYQNQDNDWAISYNLTIYDDYSIEGDVAKYAGKQINDIQNNKFDNWKDLKEIAKTKKGQDICPKYAIIKGKGLFSVVLFDYSAKGYYDEKEFQKAFVEAANAEKESFINTYLFASRVTPVWLYRVTDKSGMNIVENESAGNPNRKPTESVVGKNETNSKCIDFLGDPTDSKSVAWLLQTFFNYIKVLGPILVLLFSAIDFTKTIMNSDEEAMKKSQKKLGIRLMCAVGIYFLPMLITLIINLVFGKADASSVCGIK